MFKNLMAYPNTWRPKLTYLQIMLELFIHTVETKLNLCDKSCARGMNFYVEVYRTTQQGLKNTD